MLVFLLLAQFAFAETMDEARVIIGLATRNTYMMIAPDEGRAVGTGFSVLAPSGKRYTVTNAHVCRVSREKYMVATRAGVYYRTLILRVFAASDLCIMEGISNSEGLRLAARSFQGEQVYIAGHPAMRPLEIRAGWVLERNYEQFRCPPGEREKFGCGTKRLILTINVPVEGGSSGSSVLNGSGRVVGVVYARSIPIGAAYAISVELLRKALEQTELLEGQNGGGQ